MNERILVILNKNESAQNVNLSIPEVYNIRRATDLITNETLNVANNIVSININGIGYRILKLEK